MQHKNFFLVLAIVITVWVGLAAYTDRTVVLPWFEVVLTWMPRALGLLIAVVAAFALLKRSLAGESLDAQLPFLFPLLGGLLLVHVDWSVAITLGAVGVAVIVKQLMSRAATPPTHGGDAN